MMNTKNRLVGIVLVCALILGILPAVSLPIFAVEQQKPAYQAAHTESLILDGNLDQKALPTGQMAEGVSFDVLWNTQTLYLVVEPREGDASLEITLGEQKLSVTKAGISGIEGAKSAWGKVIEISVPYSVTDYGQSVALKLAMGDAAWDGNVVFSSLERSMNDRFLSVNDWLLENKPYWEGGAENDLENGFRFTSLYGRVDKHIRNSLIGQFNQLRNRTTNINLEFDFCAKNMVKGRAVKIDNTYLVTGLLIVMADDKTNGFSAGIAYTDKGLIFCALDKDNTYSYVELGKGLNEKFHIRLEWTTEENLNLYIDGKLIKTFENVTYNMAGRRWGGSHFVNFGMIYNNAPETVTDDMDFTLSNIALGSSYDEDPLAGLGINTIGGMNSSLSKVEYDLTLPNTYAHPSGHFPAREIVWDSAREDYISNEGKVTPHAVPLNVVLTAALKEEPSVSKQILVKVVRKSARFLVNSTEEVTMNLDGKTSEGAAAWKTQMAFTPVDGTSAPTGKLYGGWGQGKIYLAAEFNNAKQMELKLNGKTLVLDLATGAFVGESYGATAKISGNVAEVYVPLQGVNMYAYQYEQVLRFEAKLIGDGGIAALYDHQMDLLLTSEVKYEQNLNDASTIYGNPEISADGSTVTMSPVLTEQMIAVDDLGVVDHSQELTVTQTLKVTGMPAGAPGFASVTDTTGGYHFWLADGQAGAPRTLLRAKIYSAGGNLILQILKNNSMATAEVALGKTVAADAEAFELKLIWGVDGSVKVYVDGSLMGTVTGVDLTSEDDAVGSDALRIRCATTGVKVAVSDFTISLPAISQNLADSKQNGDAVVSEDGSSVILNPEAKEQILQMNGIADVDHTKDLIFSQYVQISALAASNGGFANVADTADGYNFWLVDGLQTETQALLRAKIYNNSTKGLTLQILKNGDLEIDEVVLNKAVGEAFRLDLKWNTDGSVNVLVDGQEKGTVTGVTLTCTDGSMGYDGFQLRCVAEGAKIKISNVAFRQSAGAVDMTGGTIYGGAHVSNDGSSASLNTLQDPQSLKLNGLADMDHSKDMEITHTITVNAMPASAGGFRSIADVADGYNFWFVDGAEGTNQALLRAKIYNDAANGLTLQILKDSSLTVATVALGKAVGDSFALKLGWGADNAVKVYVDDVLKDTVTGVTLTCTDGSMGYDGLQMHCGAYGTKLTVSNITLGGASAVEAMDLNEMSNYKNNVSISADGTTATLSDELNILYQDGLSQITHEVDMVLTQTVKVTAMPADVKMTAANYSVSGACYFFYMIDGEQAAASGATHSLKTATLANMYYSSAEGSLVLQVQNGDKGQYLTDVVLDKAIGDTFQLQYVWGRDNTASIYVDGVLKGTVANASYTRDQNDGRGYDRVHFECENANTTVEISNVTVAQAGGGLDLGAAETAGGVSVGGSAATFEMKDINQLVAKNELDVVDHTKDLLFSQKIHVEAMAPGRPMATGAHSISGTSYYFWLIDGGVGEAKTLAFANMYNDAERGLVLQVEHANGGFTEMVLGKQVGDTFTLGYLWGKDDTARIYVDDKLVGICYENVTWSRGYSAQGRGYDGFQIATMVGGVKVNVSEVTVSQTSVMQDLAQYNQSYVSVNNSGVASLNSPVYGAILYQDNLEAIDHSQDILLTQIIKLSRHYEDKELDVDKAMVSTDAYNPDGTNYSFYMVDGGVGEQKTMVFANIYLHSTKGLVLQVEHGDGSISEVVLNKALDDSFELGYLWGKDGSAKIYVDGVLMGTFQNVDYTGLGTSDNYGHDRLFFTRGRDTNIRPYISKVTIAHGDKLTPVVVTQNLADAELSGTASVSGSSVTLDVTAETNSVIKNGISQIDRDANVLFSQTILVEKMPVDQKMEPGTNYNNLGTGYYFWIVDGKSVQQAAPEEISEGSKTDKAISFANMYNDSAKGLVLQVQTGIRGEGFEDVVLGKKVGDTFTLGYLWKPDRTIEVYVDGALVGEVLMGRYQGYRNDSRGYDGFQLHSTSDGTKVQVSNVSISVSYVQRMSNRIKEGDVVTKETTATFDVKTTSQVVDFRDLDEMDHSRDLTLVQTIRVDAMPLDQKMVPQRGHSVMGTGYYFWMVDGVKGGAKELIFANMYNSSKHGLVLQIETGSGSFSEVVLGKKVGETFTLGLEWCADDTANVYVDGVIKGSAELVTWTNASVDSRGHDGFNLSGFADGEMKVTVSNVHLTPGGVFNSVQEELTPEAVLAGVTEIENVTQTVLNLPKTFKSPYLGEIPITWESSDPEVLNVESGKVVHSNAKVGTWVKLTMTVKDIRDRHIFSIEVYVTPNGIVEIKSPDDMTASFADNVVLDGKFTNETDGVTTSEGWHMGTIIGEDGRFAAQWDTKNLYLAAQDLNPATADALSITLKGQTISLANAVVGDGFTELAIPMSSLGIAAENYGIRIPAVIQMGEDTWAGDIVLSSTNWLVSDTSDPRYPTTMSYNKPAGVMEDLPTDHQNITQLENGYRMFDLYNIDGYNPHSIMNYVMLGSNATIEGSADLVAPMGNRDIAVFAEFDFQAKSMPVYMLGTDLSVHNGYATCGFPFLLVGKEDKTSRHAPTVSMGMINTNDGLYFVVRGQRGDTNVRLGKEVGDYFRVGLRWEVDESLTLYIDGKEFATFPKAQVSRRAFGNCALTFQTLRSEVPASSSNDNIDIYISNIAIGQNYGDTLLDTLTYGVIRGKNGKDMGSVTRDLKLVETWSTEQLPTPQKVTWSSSDPAVINPETGDVVRPEGNGKQVVLTATCGGESREFVLFVKGLNPDGLYMAVIDDRDTANGVGKPENEKHEFILDTDNSSIILDQGEKQKVNVIELIDSDEIHRLNESTLTIWYSDDNESYTKLDEYFKILHVGTKTYLYDFTVEARYIKVHCTHYSSNEADFINILRDMIRVDYVSVFGDGDMEFTTTSEVSVENTNDTTLYDQYFVISPADAGVACVKEDKSDVRFFLGDELLYHYFDGENFVVRVTKIPANDAVALTVLSGNAEAMDISNKEYVYEVVYGTREGIDEDVARWIITLPDGTMMSFKAFGASVSSKAAGYRISTNGGLTWSAETEIEASRNFIQVPQGALYDDHIGRIVVMGRMATANGGYKLRFVYSDDLGKSWKQSAELINLGKHEEYLLTHTDPVEVSVYDGEEGPNVDYVIPVVVGNTDLTLSYVPMWVRVAYSCDAGKTWYLGADEIQYHDGEGLFERENGFNEATIEEDKFGRLVCIARCQYKNVDQFGVAYSYDFGKTWESANGKNGAAELSTVYAPNTQPILFKHDQNVFLSWGGNNVLGGASYMRVPFNIALGTDDLENFINIQNMYSRYSMDGVTVSTGVNVVNQTVTAAGDTVTHVWNDFAVGAPSLKIENFTDYFYRTRGAYDSFEKSTVKYEGWVTSSGTVSRSDAVSTDGSYSMQIDGTSSALRSIPYLQTGSVSFDFYVEDINAGEFQIELESAYGTIHGKAAPVALTVRDGKLYFLAADRAQGEVEVAANLRNGWNSITFDLDLVAENAGATMSVNGGEATAVPVALEIGNYVCYVHITTLNGVKVYVDDFLAIDDDNFPYPEKDMKDEVTELTEVPEELKETYADVSAMSNAMMNALVEANKDGYTAQGSTLYNVGIQITRDNGKTWSPAKADDIPTDGYVVKIPYPKNTFQESHTFSAVAMPVFDSYRLDVDKGEAKILSVTAEADAVYVAVLGSGPVLLTWVQTGEAPAAPSEDSNTWIFIIIGVLAALAAAAAVILVIRKKRASAPVIADAAEEMTAEDASAEENENEVNHEEET